MIAVLKLLLVRFLLSSSKYELTGLQFTVATQIGLKLGIVQNKANFISSTYKPNIVVSNKDLLAGRASLQRQKDSVTLINR